MLHSGNANAIDNLLSELQCSSRQLNKFFLEQIEDTNEKLQTIEAKWAANFKACEAQIALVNARLVTVEIQLQKLIKLLEK